MVEGAKMLHAAQCSHTKNESMKPGDWYGESRGFYEQVLLLRIKNYFRWPVEQVELGRSNFFVVFLIYIPNDQNLRRLNHLEPFILF